MKPIRVQCPHGYVLSQTKCLSEPEIQLVACHDVPLCPAYAPAKFSDDDLNLIMAMCTSANPQYPERDMYPAWQHVYEVASNQLKIMESGS